MDWRENSADGLRVHSSSKTGVYALTGIRISLINAEAKAGVATDQIA
jgi:hypothetical protein